jgi:hypothetical protein
MLRSILLILKSVHFVQYSLKRKNRAAFDSKHRKKKRQFHSKESNSINRSTFL